MKYQEKLKTLETCLDGWNYLDEVLASWDVIINELTFIKNEPNLDEEYVLAKLQKSKELIQNSIKLLKRKK